MKLMSWIMIAICCVMAWTPVTAQQRDRDRGAARERMPTSIYQHNYRPGYRGGGRRYYSERRPGWRYESGRGWYDPSVAIGSAIGSFLWRQWAQPEPEPVRDVAWCMNRYRSYDPYTRTYLGYDGLRHGCP